MQPDEDIQNIATCTTCRFKEDKSNYWTAVMYFKHSNGSFIRLPQIPNHIIGTPNGGMTVYYIPGYPPYQKVSAFTKGFRMVTGDPMIRMKKPSDPDDVASWALTFRCWTDTDFWHGVSNQFAPGAGPYDTVHLPDKPCPAGIRANIFFPNCWDGKSLDSYDHKSHMSFAVGKVDPGRGLFFNNASCPASHPVRTPTVLYETYWDTTVFKDMWPADGSQPFVLSMGDPTGFGQHGDYLFGWEGDSLQRAMDTCKNDFGYPESCPELTIQSDEEINSCTQPVKVNEKTEGEYLPALPGCNPLQPGPAPATMVKSCDAVSTTGIPAPTQV